MRVSLPREHRFVFEFAASAVEVKACDLWQGSPAIRGLGDGHLGSLDRVKEAIEEDNDVRVVDVAARVEGDAWVGAEIHPIRRRRRRQRQINGSPGLAAVTGKIAAHG